LYKRQSLTWSLLLGEDEFEEMVELRGAIELRCLCRIFSSLQKKNERAIKIIEKLEDIVNRMSVSAGKKDYSKISDLDLNFHLMIIDFADNELFNSLYETLKAFLKEEVEMTNLNYQDPAEIYQEHKILLDALKSGDKLLLLNEYENHLKNILLHLNIK
jgi:GntR family transcriptional repressor for pyruvate dehydrogenase complex